MATGAEARPLALPVILFIFSLILPFGFSLGPVTFTPSRFLLVLLILPLILGWISGRYGGIKRADLLLVAFLVWYGIALTYHHGLSQIQGIGQNFIEAFGGYLLGRAYVRDAAQFRAMVGYLTVAVLITLPFAALESFTGRLLLHDLLRSLPLIEVHDLIVSERRFGLDRAQGLLEHPILYGLFCGSVLTMAYLVRRSLVMSGVAVLGTFFSLSSGALMTVVLQTMLLGWNWLTKTVKKRWRLLCILAVLAYIVIDLLSNRTPVQVLISYATFNAGTGYWRLAIWEYGSQNVIDNPIFGIGLNDWVRPSWMGTGSVDNFWLVMGMRSGLPGVLLLIAAFTAAVWSVSVARLPQDSLAVWCRRAWIITLVAIFLAACTVHIWAGTYTYLMFLVGAGLWMADLGAAGTGGAGAVAPAQAGPAGPARPLPEPGELRGHARWQGRRAEPGATSKSASKLDRGTEMRSSEPPPRSRPAPRARNR